jgi:hypothetical protein
LKFNQGRSTLAQSKKLSDAQTKALDEADSIVERAFQEAAIKVKSARPGNGNGDDSSYGHCLRCGCGGYVPPTGIATHSLKCQREGCGHLFPSHDVF